MAEQKKSIHAKHRQGLREEFRAQGLEGWREHKVLELLLFYAIPRVDVNPLAHALIDRFGSLAEVFHATYEQLLSVKGIGERTATLILLIPALGGRYLQELGDLKGIVQTAWEFRQLLEGKFLGARNELVYMVCLDAKYKLIATFMLGEGIADAATITTRKVMETALGCNASVVVLAHNHVSGLALPSAEDIATTRQLAKSLKLVGILLHDHFIFVDGDMTSMRESGYLDN